MERFVVEGGQRLSGTITPTGNKNAALPLLAATLLTECLAGKIEVDFDTARRLFTLISVLHIRG